MSKLPCSKFLGLLAAALITVFDARNGLADPAAGNQAVCVEPFCTYGPPKLSADAMAAATREIIAAAQKVDLGFPPEKWPEEQAFLDAFLAGDGFEFISPSYIAEGRQDLHLLDMLDPDCIRHLTEIEYENGPPDDFTGPFYLYNVKPSLGSSDEYSALFVFGGATKTRHKGMNFDERVEWSQSTGRFYILDRNRRCERLFTWSISGREEREFVTRYTPRFAGVGYYEGAFLVYALQGINTLIDPAAYRFAWQFGTQPPQKKRKTDRYGSALLPSFPEDFDPFAIVNRQESLP